MDLLNFRWTMLRPSGYAPQARAGMTLYLWPILHVCYMYLHLVELYGKSRHIYRSSQQNLPRPQLGPFWRCLWSSFFALLQIAPLWPSRSFFHCHGALATRVARFPSTASKEKKKHMIPLKTNGRNLRNMFSNNDLWYLPLSWKRRNIDPSHVCVFFGGVHPFVFSAVTTGCWQSQGVGSQGQFCLDWRVEMWYKVWRVKAG